MHLSIYGKCDHPPTGIYRRLVGDLTIVSTSTRSGDLTLGVHDQQQMALRIDQLLTPNHGAFHLINVKSGGRTYHCRDGAAGPVARF